jgi:predicted lipoprotein with Yx(FWY)xxD motif
MRTSGIGEQERVDRSLGRHGRGPLVIALLVVAAVLALPGGAAAAVLYPPIAGNANRTASGFELTGTVYNYGGAGATTTYHFEYGTTTAYGTSVPMPDADAGSGLASSVSQQISGLQANTTYHYRLVSTNSVEGTGFSADRTFSTAETTTPPPSGTPPTTTPPPGTTPGKTSPGTGTGTGNGTGTGTGAGAYPGYPGESGGGGAAGGNATGGKGPKTVVKVAKVGARTLLTTIGGRTLYSLSVETHGKFICTASSGCTAIWHPLTVAAGVVPKGPVALGTVKRPEGTTQVTYRGRPLYTFGGDRKSGQTKGEGLHDVGVWHAATAPSRSGH